MYKFRGLLWVTSLIFAFFSAYLGYQLIHSSTEKSVEQEYISVPIASKNIPAFTTIKAEDLIMVKLPKEISGKISYVSDTSNIIGQITSKNIKSNSLINQEDFIELDMTKPFGLPKGFRAVSITNTPLINIGGNLSPGMYVDVLWTFENNAKEKLTKLAFQNVKVLAIDNQSKEGNSNEDSKTVTIMLSLKDAIKLVYMQNSGTLQFVLRPSNMDEEMRYAPIIRLDYLVK